MESTAGRSATIGDASADGGGGELGRGSSVGRYIVLQRIGGGGMGVVYAAYDPELDRRIALKLLRRERSSSPNALARVLREAQAMARLNHPNVVTLHDVGEHGGEVFLAMEFVEGLTLGQWCELAAPRLPERLRVMLAAGEGLAAAHDKGLVHRDFKPDNVMIGDDGRVRVMDFGLVRGDAGLGSTREDEHERPAAEVFSAELTHHGAILGTPGYMAPEQHDGGPVGPAADQFAFCVTLYEALWGERPPREASMAADGSRASTVPRWLQRVVLRGLAEDPAQRWPSMHALLDALRRDPTPRRRRLVVLATAVGLAMTGAAGWQWLASSRRQACEEAVSEIDAHWNPSVAAAVQEAMRATALPHVDETFERTAARLSGFASEWRVARAQLCDGGEAEPSAESPALACLRDRSAELAELVDALSTPSRATVGDAITASAALAPPRDCLTPNDTGAGDEGMQAAGAPARRIRDRLARASARRWVGDHLAAESLAEAALAEADALGVDRLRARARYELGTALIQRGDYVRAEALLREAYAVASTSGDDGMAADAAQALVYTVGFDERRFGEAELWVQLCSIHHDRVGLPADDPRRAALRSEIATLRYAQGRLAESRDEYRAALAMFEHTTTPEDPSVLGALADLAIVEAKLGDLVAADVTSGRVVAVTERVFGSDHPRAANALASRGEVLRQLGRHDEALAAARRVLAIRERTLGPEAEDVAAASVAVASLLPPDEERRAHLTRARSIFQRVHGPDHPLVGRAEALMGQWHLDRGDAAEAIACFQRALAIAERAHAGDQPATASVLFGLGKALALAGEHEEALARVRSAEGMIERLFGEQHWSLAGMRFVIARIELARADAGAPAQPTASPSTAKSPRGSRSTRRAP